MVGAIVYLVNYNGQIDEKERIELAESRLNQLNRIYVDFLKAVRDNRGYRLYRIPERKAAYLYAKNEVLNRLESYAVAEGHPRDSVLFAKMGHLMKKRFENLDYQLQIFEGTALPDRSAHAGPAIDALIDSLEQTYNHLVGYWMEKSDTASSAFNAENDRNDRLFIIWLIATAFLFVLFLLTFKSKVNAQIRSSVSEQTLAITREKEREFSAAFEYAAIGMALVGTDGSWLRLNKSLCSLLEYGEEELKRMTFQDITHPEDLSIDLAYVQQMLRGEIDTYQMEKRYYTKSGKLVWVLLSVSLVWENDRPKHFISQIQDISQRKALLREVEVERERLKQIIYGTGAGTWEWNVQTGEVIFNETWANLIGYTLEELEPTDIDTWISHAHPDDLAISNEKLQACFEGRVEQYECACRMRHKDGHWVWIMDRGKVISWSEDGKPLMMYGSHLDISASKKLEDSLRAARRKFETIFNSTFQFIGFLTPDGTLLEANQTALEFGGLKPKDVVGKKFWECHWWQISKTTQEALKKAISRAANGENIQYEVAVWDRDRQPVTILFHLKPLKNDAGEVTSIIPEGTVIQDIVDARNALVAANQELDGFAAIAAHDLKEPLRMISQFVDRIVTKYEGVFDDRGKQYLNFVIDASSRMSLLISDLLEYARAGSDPASFQWVDLNQTVKAVEELLKNNILEHNAKITVKGLPNVWAQQTAMKVLFQNLLGNALKYQEQGKTPKICIFEEPDKHYHVIKVKDNGIGMSPNNIKTIFQPFNRIHGQGKYAGVGMGLATCKKIIEAHGGDITVKSTPGEGSIFLVRIPKVNIS